MLCYVFLDYVISFKSFNILDKIWQIISKFATRPQKNISVDLYVHSCSWKINVHWIRFPGVKKHGYQNAYQCDPKDSAGAIPWIALNINIVRKSSLLSQIVYKFYDNPATVCIVEIPYYPPCSMVLNSLNPVNIFLLAIDTQSNTVYRRSWVYL